MNATRKVKLKDITANLTCKLCEGYLVDATTIIECLHSFCKSCIITYLEKSASLEEKYCPVCDVQLHSTKPLTSIRSDLMLQEIVYKLVPGLFKDEMSRRRKFYGESPSAVSTNQLDSGQVFDELYITSDDIIHLSLEYVTDDVGLKDSTRRYLKCPAAVSVCILKKFLLGKYDLPGGTVIDVKFGDRILPDDFLLMDIAYKYSWTMNGSKPLALSYRIRDFAKKPEIKIEKTINDSIQIKDRSVSQEELASPISKKKVCKENGSNIMPTEQLKLPNPKKIKGNGLISIGPIKTPNGKVRGRKRKHLNYSDVLIQTPEDVKNLAKKAKLTNKGNSHKPQANGMVQTSTQVDADKLFHTQKSDTEVKEVQLQISENGVMCAKSGKEKFILNVETSFPHVPISTASPNVNPSPTTSQNIDFPEKLLLSGNFHSKLGPGGVTEIICDKPDPSSEVPKPAAKPGYVTLSIPNPTSALLSQQGFRYRTIYTDLDKMEEVKCGPIPQNGSNALNDKSPKKKSNKVKSSTKEKIKNRILGKEGENANVRKAISDLGKLCNGITVTTTTPSPEINGESQKTPGVHTLPIVSNLNTKLLKTCRPKPINGTPKNGNGFPLPLLNFSPASGMSVSMIPSSSINTSSIASTSPTVSASMTPPKRPSHQTTVVNGNMKFTTSPKKSLEDETSPKKPPKFFKSRHATGSPVPLMPKQPSPHEKDTHDPTRKTLANGVNGDRKKESERPILSTTMYSPVVPQINFGQQASASAASPIQSLKGLVNGNLHSKPIMHPMVSADKYPHLSALSSLAGNSPEGFSVAAAMVAQAAAAAAAAAQNGNGIPLEMVPYLTDSYGQLAFLNQRHTMPQLSLPYGYANLAAAAVVNPNILSMAKSPGGKSDGGPASPKNSSHMPIPATKTEMPSSLNLTVSKASNSNGGSSSISPRESSPCPLLSNLLTSKCKTPPATSERNSNSPKHDRANAKSPAIKIPNGDHRSSPSTFSPTANIQQNGNKGSPSLLELIDKLSPPTKTNGSHLLTMEVNGNKKDTPNGILSNHSYDTINKTAQETKLSCLTAQNNNNPTISNNYNKSGDSSAPSSLECANGKRSSSGTPELGSSV